MDNLSQFKDKKVFFVTHLDLDGIACYLLFKKYIEPLCHSVCVLGTDDRNFEEISLEALKQYDYCLITDLGISKDSWDRLENVCKNIFVFDHHVSGKRLLGDVSNYFFDEQKSAALIFYEWIFESQRENPIVKSFVFYCDVYDMWKCDSKDFRVAKSLNYSLYAMRKYGVKDVILSYQDFIQSQLTKFKQPKDTFYFTPYELSLITKEEIKEKKMYDLAKSNLKIRTDSQGNRYAYCEISSKASIVANSILKELADIKYIVVYNTYRKKELKVSLRCRPNFDVSTISEKWGGGGHKQAASFHFISEDAFHSFKVGNTHLI